MKSKHGFTPLWKPDAAGGGGSDDSSIKEGEVLLDAEKNVGLDDLAELLQSNPVARQLAETILQSQSGTGTENQPTTPTEPQPIVETRQRLQQVEEQLQQNPQDAQLFAQKILLEATLKSLEATQQMLVPIHVQQQVNQVINTEIPQVLKEIAAAYPGFDDFADNVRMELQQALMTQPELGNSPQMLRHTAELIADHYFSQHIRSGKVPTGALGQRAHVGAGAPAPTKIEGLTDEEAQAFQEAKRFYPEMTPEEWKAYNQATDETEREYNLTVRNVLGVPKQ